MKLGTGTIGRLGRSEPSPPDEIAERRIQQARKRTRWQEIPEERLVRRDQWWVDAETDELLTIYRGDIFDRGGIVIFDENRDDLRFYVSPAGEVIVLEPSTLAPTWSAYVYQRERAAGRPMKRAVVRLGRIYAGEPEIPEGLLRYGRGGMRLAP